MNRKALEIAACEHLPWISYSPELHGSIETFFNLYPPSTTLTAQVPWISVHSTRYKDKYRDLDGLSSAWLLSRTLGQTKMWDVDKLAKQFNVLSGSWLVNVAREKVDELWESIVEFTLAGVLGVSAKVSYRESYLDYKINIFNADYTSRIEVNGVLSRCCLIPPQALIPQSVSIGCRLCWMERSRVTIPHGH